jgi:hypothetical protein
LITSNMESNPVLKYETIDKNGILLDTLITKPKTCARVQCIRTDIDI